MATKVPWSASIGNCCPAPDGCGACCGGCCCMYCIRGEIAAATGGNYLLSCLGALLATPLIGAGIWACDRRRLVEKYHIDDTLPDWVNYALIFILPCCTTIQEIAHIKASARNEQGTYNPATGMIAGAHQMVVPSAQVMMAPAQMIMMAPAGGNQLGYPQQKMGPQVVG